MKLREELTDPRTYVLGGIAGGAAWAVLQSPPVVFLALPVGAAVAGVKVLLGSLLGSGTSNRLPSVRKGSVEERWIKRADRTAKSLNDLNRAAAQGAVRDRVSSVRDRADKTIGSLHRLGSQASTMARALKGMHPNRLEAEGRRLSKSTNQLPNGPIRAERERALKSIEDQIAVYRRLHNARAKLLARMESTVIELEGLLARLSEILAMSQSASGFVDGMGRLDGLVDELEGLRSGIAETEQVSQQVLSAYMDAAG